MRRGRTAAVLRRLLGERRGATIVEFGIIVPALAVLMMGLGDLLYGMYVKELLNGAIQKAGRDSAIQGGAQQVGSIDSKVIDTMTGVMARPVASCATAPAGGTYCSSRRSYATFGAIGPEPFDDTNGNNIRDPGECYTDVNGNGQWDAEPGIIGQGGANDVTLYKMSITYVRLFPVARLLGVGSTSTITAQTVLKNQPYATQVVPTVTRKCT